jgi:hypothetical protein
MRTAYLEEGAGAGAGAADGQQEAARNAAAAAAMTILAIFMVRVGLLVWFGFPEYPVTR